MTYARPLTVTVAFINRETGEIREQSVFMGDFPWMTERGTFVINGTERVVVTQLVRSPGAYLMEPKDREKQVFIANLMPARGSWLELEIDKKGKVFVRIDRKRKLPVTVLLRAMGYASDEEILRLFDNSLYIRNTIDSDTDVTRTEEGALIELFKKQRPGEPPSVDNARALLNQLFFDPKRYDLTRVGRYKLNSRLGLDVDIDTRTLTQDDILALVRELVSLPKRLGLPEDGEIEIKDYAAEAMSMPREPVADRLDEYEHFGNRRLRTVGELIQEAFRIGLYRMERVVRERLTTEDADTITPQTIINIRPVVAALKEFFGSSQLSQFMDQTNSLAGLTHRRRLSALGRRRADPRAGPDRGPRRAPHPLRPHVPDRDPRGSQHRPDRLAVLVRGGVRVRLRHHPLPGGQGRGRDERGPPPRRHPGRGAADRPGEHPGGRQDRPPEGRRDPLPHPGRPVRHRRPQGRGPGGRVPRADLVGGHGHDPVPRARRRQPRPDGLEHAAPGGAPADRRRPPGGHRHGAPRGARHRRRAARQQRRHGRLHRRRPDRPADDRRQEGGVRAAEVHALQPGHPDPPQAARHHRPEDQGRRRARRRLLHRQGRDGAGQEPDGRLHVLGGLQLRGRHHPVPPPGPGRRAHLDPHRGVRDRRPHDQARRGGDHPRHPQPLRGVAAQPRRPRHRPHRRRGPVRRPAGRQGHARRARPSSRPRRS